MSAALSLPLDLSQDRRFSEANWYHRIELRPNVFTDGKDRGNLVITRQLLANCAVEGQKCLDIGAQDGLVSVLLRRRGASEVVAYDRLDHLNRLNLIKECLEVEFEYLPGQPLICLPELVRGTSKHPFDLVVFSGVLYHMADPLTGLAIARGMVRDGGLMVIETAAIIDDDAFMSFNRAGRFYPGSNYWMMSLGCLEYLCRVLRMAPIDIAYLNPRPLETGHQLARVAVVCRAGEQFLPTADDQWLGQAPLQMEYDELVRFEDLTCPGSTPLGYETKSANLIRRADTNTVDLVQSMSVVGPTTAVHNRQCLMLGDCH